MIVVNTHEAKTHLSRLLARVAAGEEVTIAKAGRPMARLVPARPPAGKRQAGMDRGLYEVPADFDAEVAEITAAFES